MADIDWIGKRALSDEDVKNQWMVACVKEQVEVMLGTERATGRCCTVRGGELYTGVVVGA